jgi:hypothetical protein
MVHMTDARHLKHRKNSTTHALDHASQGTQPAAGGPYLRVRVS